MNEQDIYWTDSQHKTKIINKYNLCVVKQNHLSMPLVFAASICILQAYDLEYFLDTIKTAMLINLYLILSLVVCVCRYQALPCYHGA